LLIRAGLLSRAAAIGAVNDLNRVFIDGREMAEWLRSNEVTVLTDTGQWPTPATAEIWRVFRSDVLSGGIEKWRSNVWQHQLTTVAELEFFGNEQTCRAEQDDDGYVWIKTPDFRPLLRLPHRARDPQPSLLHAQFELGAARVLIHRIGRGELEWVSGHSLAVSAPAAELRHQLKSAHVRQCKHETAHQRRIGDGRVGVGSGHRRCNDLGRAEYLKNWRSVCLESPSVCCWPLPP
jgi:hypothetical protein